MKKLRRGMTVVLLSILCWKAYIYNAGGVFAEGLAHAPSDITPPNIDASIRLTTDATADLASRYVLAGATDTAVQLSMQAFARNPTNGRIASQLLTLYAQRGQHADTAKLANIADRLWPSHTDVHSRLADYWLQQQRIDRLVPEWNILLTRERSFHNRLFPGLGQLVFHPEYSRLLQPYIDTPPAWWNDFFRYIAANSELSLLRSLYLKRSMSGTTPSSQEREALINRLLESRQWQEAYEIWQKSLSDAQQKLFGTPFDSKFEGMLSGTGFDWQIRASRGLQIGAGTIQGMEGNQALHILLRKDRHINFQHVLQRLVLDPGEYRLKIRYRADRLKTAKGLRWRIRCLDNMDQVLVESSPIFVRTPWDTLTSTFSTPSSGCSGQLLRLEASSQYAHYQIFDGSIWFDSVSIERLD